MIKGLINDQREQISIGVHVVAPDARGTDVNVLPCAKVCPTHLRFERWGKVASI